jgi:hypothetical protein
VIEGTVSAQTTGETLEVLGNNLVFSGILQSVGNGALKVFVDDWSSGGTFLLDDGLITLAGSAFVNGPTGVIRGTGTLDVSGTTFRNHGAIAPDTGGLDIIGHYVEGPAALLEIDIGELPGNLFGSIHVDGDVVLASSLVVNLVDGFNLAPGNQYPILTATGTIGGGFIGLSEGAIVREDAGVGLFITYRGNGGHDVVLSAILIPTPGTVSMGAAALAMMLGIRCDCGQGSRGRRTPIRHHCIAPVTGRRLD